MPSTQFLKEITIDLQVTRLYVAARCTLVEIHWVIPRTYAEPFWTNAWPIQGHRLQAALGTNDNRCSNRHGCPNHHDLAPLNIASPFILVQENSLG